MPNEKKQASRVCHASATAALVASSRFTPHGIARQARTCGCAVALTAVAVAAKPDLDKAPSAQEQAGATVDTHLGAKPKVLDGLVPAAALRGAAGLTRDQLDAHAQHTLRPIQRGPSGCLNEHGVLDGALGTHNVTPPSIHPPSSSRSSNRVARGRDRGDRIVLKPTIGKPSPIPAERLALLAYRALNHAGRLCY